MTYKNNPDHQLVQGEAFQNEPGKKASFETDLFPNRTFEIDNFPGLCSPGMTAEINAVVILSTGRAVFHSEI